jgi:hypothetical protein
MMNLPDHEPVAFPRRKNENGTFDSICPICFRTVASGVKESQLAELERNHICEDRFMSPS